MTEAGLYIQWALYTNFDSGPILELSSSLDSRESNICDTDFFKRQGQPGQTLIQMISGTEIGIGICQIRIWD